MVACRCKLIINIVFNQLNLVCVCLNIVLYAVFVPYPTAGVLFESAVNTVPASAPRLV